MLQTQYLLISLCFCFASVNCSFYRVCYYPYEGNAEGVLTPEKLNITLCTHILFAFALIHNNTVVPRHARDVEGYGLVTALRKKSPNLKVILSIGTNSGLEYSQMVSSRRNRDVFIRDSMNFLRKFDFDGIDFDWEFPAVYPNPPEDRSRFAKFLQEFNLARFKESLKTKKPRLSLSAAVVATEPLLSVGYDVPKISKAVDFINIMCYDYSTYKDAFPFTGHNSPLYSRRVEKGYFGTINMAWTAKQWQRKGAPRNKIVIGLPTYGRTYKLLDSKKNGLYAPSVGVAFGSSDINYPEVCEFLEKGAVRVFDSEMRVPYAFKNKDWLGYDDVGSITEKSKWIKKNQFLGAMVWSLMSDDWEGRCQKNVTFPLHTAVYNVLNH